MAFEALKILKEEENKANEMIAKAREDAVRIVREAEKRAASMLETAKKEAQEESKRQVAAAESEAKQQVSVMNQNSQGDKQRIEETGQKNVAKAAAFVMERIVSTVGGS